MTSEPNRKSLGYRQTPYSHLSVEDRLKILANIIIDRAIEEEAAYRERLKTDPHAKRIYDTCTCKECVTRRKKLQDDATINI